MRKIAAVFAAFLMLFSLAACANSGRNGVYQAQRGDAYVNGDGNGWRDTLSVTYENGVIRNAEFDSEYAIGELFPTGTKKSTLTLEEYPMNDKPVSQWIPELSEKIVIAGSAASLDAITGATIASDSARAMLEAIEKQGRPGEVIEVP